MERGRQNRVQRQGAQWDPDRNRRLSAQSIAQQSSGRGWESEGAEEGESSLWVPEGDAPCACWCWMPALLPTSQHQQLILPRAPLWAQRQGLVPDPVARLPAVLTLLAPLGSRLRPLWSLLEPLSLPLTLKK